MKLQFKDHDGTPTETEFDHAVRIRFDGTTPYADHEDELSTLHLDDYKTYMDVVADLVYEHLGYGSAYTSTSSVPGYFNMDGDGVLVFGSGMVWYVWDDSEEPEESSCVPSGDTVISALEEW